MPSRAASSRQTECDLGHTLPHRVPVERTPAPPAAATTTRDAPPADGDDDRPDEALVGRAALGDHAAFTTLVTRHGAALYRYARRLLPSAHDAEDAVQDALTAAWLGADAYRGDASVRTWLFGIQTNCVRRSARRRSHAPVPVPDDARREPRDLTSDEPAEHLLATDLRAALDRALAALPGPQRAVWLLVEVEGMTYADAARVLGTTHAAVRGSLERARHTLAGRFASWR
ncbi:sigma-70 family RNA polymerase sigma factor [Cellulomonas sp. Sa3CUA2]|uniref:Sigma-70 family RNA polymerase sigma factor n=1 Tax=Cellulomonas avistercoris TaxID=2762242 RepID=A0ABR8QH97_9CELL|nr:sigma-70 family RNA polymerase sigma factor [Cellulomonas avistercoris]MBD7919807.1 sigma-70 family RNA polymerase sigma factor [Cellulomonas avistercoris]